MKTKILTLSISFAFFSLIGFAQESESSRSETVDPAEVMYKERIAKEAAAKKEKDCPKAEGKACCKDKNAKSPAKKEDDPTIEG